MKKITVECKHCGKKLDVADNGKPTIRFRCHYCNEISTVAPERNEEGADGFGNKTIKPTDVSRYRIGKLVCSHREYPLQLGQNTIGRAHRDCKASLQIQIDDQYMSRSQAIIEVIRQPDKTVRAVLSFWTSQNALYVNGQKMQPGDRVMLNQGDTIQMGVTLLRYIVPND